MNGICNLCDEPARVTDSKECVRCQQRAHINCLPELPRRTDDYLCATCLANGDQRAEDNVGREPAQSTPITDRAGRTLVILEEMIGQLMEQSEIQERRFAMREATFGLMLQRVEALTSNPASTTSAYDPPQRSLDSTVQTQCWRLVAHLTSTPSLIATTTPM